MKTTLSLCMIAKNEADKISRCLASVKDFADEIIVVDTGSTDRTQEIAREFGATVLESRWEDNFSKARNTSLDYASSDWILFLDCDEELDTASGPILRELIENSHYEAFFIRVINTTEVETQLIVNSIRLFRNRPVYRFEGKLHEQIVYSIIRNYGRQSIGNSDITIVHHGYNAADVNIQAKIQRNMKILNSYTEEEKDGFYYYNVGTEYLRIGDRQKALESYMEAVKWTYPGAGFGPILVKKIITTLMELERFSEAIRQLRYYQSIYKDFSDLIFLEAICHLNSGRYTQALKYLEQYRLMPPSPDWYPTETRYFGVSPEELIEKVKTIVIEKDYPDITVLILGQNEEDHLARCIKSVNEIAAELIFVDSGSIDRSSSIAQEYGAEIYSISWPSNSYELFKMFIERAKSKWIFWLNADEVLADESRPAITELIKEAQHKGYLLKINTYLERNLLPANTEIKPSLRLFHKTLKEFIHPKEDLPHEYIVPADISIHHLHYHSKEDYILAKKELKTRYIMEQMELDSPQQLYALGVVHFYGRDFVAAEHYFEACHIKGGIVDEASFFYYYALSLINTGKYSKVVDLLEDPLERFSDYIDLCYLYAIAAYMLGNVAEAEKSLQENIQSELAPWSKYICSPGTGTLKALCSLGTIYGNRGNISGALQCFTRAAEMPGGFEQAVDSIVILHDKLPMSVKSFLESNGILNAENLGMIAQSYAGMGRLRESMQYFDLACQQAAQETTPGLSVIYGASEVLLSAFRQQINNTLREATSIEGLF